MNLKWPAHVDWKSPAGLLLARLAEIVPAARRTPILLFGSAALQVTVAPTVLSEDADIAPDVVPYSPGSEKFRSALDRVELTQLIHRHGLGKGQRKLHIQINAFQAFDPGSRWGHRFMTVDKGNIQFTIPHPIDILMSKLHRFEEKDLDAFRKIYAQTGFPTADELLSELRATPRLFAKRESSHAEMPSQFPESRINESVPKLFVEMYGKRINVRRDILLPAEQAIASSYNDHETGHQSDLNALANMPLENLPAVQGSAHEKKPRDADIPHVPKTPTETTTEKRAKKPGVHE
jgi:hypothetical protein